MGCGQGKAPRRAKKFQLIRKDGWSTQQVRCAFLFLIAALNLSVDVALLRNCEGRSTWISKNSPSFTSARHLAFRLQW
jgi:hypothetical protein